MAEVEIKLPTVRLLGRGTFKVLYGGEKWIFEQGIEYKDVHPSFSAHLATLKDNQGNPLFRIEHDIEEVTALPDGSLDAVQTDGNLKDTLKRKAVQLRNGTTKKKHRPHKLNTM